MCDESQQSAKKHKIRSTKAQIIVLTNYMATHKEFANSEYSGPIGYAKFLKEWEELRSVLREHGADKTVEQWRHTWRDIKKTARNEIAAANHVEELSLRSQLVLDTIEYNPDYRIEQDKTLSFIKIMKNEGRCIWDPNDVLYPNKFHVAKTWTNVAKAAGIPVQVAKVKWKNLRDLFRREIKKFNITSLESYSGKWFYVKPLWFIFNTLKPIHARPLDNNEPGDEEEEVYEEYETLDEEMNNRDPIGKVDKSDESTTHDFFIKMEQHDDNMSHDDDDDQPVQSNVVDVDFDPISTESTTKIAQVTNTTKPKQSSSEEDFDDMFLRSLMPYFRTLEPLRKLRVRSKIQEILASELLAQEAQSS